MIYTWFTYDKHQGLCDEGVKNLARFCESRYLRIIVTEGRLEKVQVFKSQDLCSYAVLFHF